jgi:hypothetical protein
MAKIILPSMTLSCELCRAVSHGKAFTVHIGGKAVLSHSEHDTLPTS